MRRCIAPPLRLHADPALPVSWSVYKTYASSASVWGSILYLLSQILTQVLQVGRDWVLKAWAGAEPGHDKYYLTIYAIMGLSGSLAICVGPLILYAWLVIASARRLHDGLFASIRSTKLQWFENTPTGRILNLFSRDVNTVDEVLPRVISSALRTLMVAVGVVCVVTYSVPPFVLAIIPLAYAYSKVMKVRFDVASMPRICSHATRSTTWRRRAS